MVQEGSDELVDGPALVQGKWMAGERRHSNDRPHRGCRNQQDARRAWVDVIAQPDLGLGWSPERGPAASRLDGGLDYLAAGVAEQQRAPRLDEVDVAAAVDVLDDGAVAAREEARRPADRTVRAHR